MPTISTKALSRGLGSFASAITGGQGAYDTGMEKGATTQGKIAQMMASVQAQEASARAHDAAAKKSAADAGQTEFETKTMGGRAGVGDELLASAAGTNVPTVNAWRQAILTGSTPTASATGDTDLDEMIGMKGGPVVSSDIAKALARLAPQYAPYRTNTKDMSPDDLAKARALDAATGRRAQVDSGELSPELYAKGQYAEKGQPLYHFSEFGVGDNFTGKVDDTGGAAQRFGKFRDSGTAENLAQAGSAKASAANSYAAARSHDATTAKTRQETEMGGKGVLQQTDSGLVLVNPRNATSVPVTGPDGKPLSGKSGSLNGEQANALTFANRMQASQDIIDQMAKKGVYRGSLIKQGAEAVPLVGGGLGMVANAVASPEQQQVEQAQRDFINAVLRRESGAAISMGEFSNAAKQYFDQPNDDKVVRAQKRASRQRVIDGMIAAVPKNMREMPKREPQGAEGDWGDGWSIQKVQ